MRGRILVSLSLCLALGGCDDGASKADAKKDAPAKAEEKKADAADTKTAQKPAEKKPLPEPDAKVGQPAPDFELTDLDGKAHKLSDYKGKTVVLEWFNPQCPFVKYAHGEGPLKDMAAKEMEQDVVWLSINSGAPGKQGHGADTNKAGVQTYGMSNPVLLDEDGAVGYTYGARKTPHMFLIDAEGVLQYAGALDNAPIGEVDGGGEKVNYLATALADLRGGKPVATAQTKPYGCSVKYDRS